MLILHLFVRYLFRSISVFYDTFMLSLDVDGDVGMGNSGCLCKGKDVDSFPALVQLLKSSISRMCHVSLN